MNWSRKKKATSLAKPDVVIARGAAREADKRLQATQAQWPEVTALAQRLADMRQRNHFAEMIRTAILGEE